MYSYVIAFLAFASYIAVAFAQDSDKKAAGDKMSLQWSAAPDGFHFFTIPAASFCRH